MRVFREHLSNFVFALLSFFGIEGRMWLVIVLIPDHCLSIYLENFKVMAKTGLQVSIINSFHSF